MSGDGDCGRPLTGESGSPTSSISGAYIKFQQILHNIRQHILLVPSPLTPLQTEPSDMFMDKQGNNVEEELRIWAQAQGLVAEGQDGGIEVLEFVKWSLGESAESA